MKTVLVYFSRGGNTLKVAEAIAEELKITPINIKKNCPDVTDWDLLIVGSGTYGDKPGKELESYLKTLDQVSDKKTAFFCTCAGDATKTISTMKQLLENKGYTTIGSFSCFGKLALIKRGHPTNEELNQARTFAKNLTKPST